MQSPFRSLKPWLARVFLRRKQDARRTGRRLRLESLENRALLASDLAAIAGTVFVDVTDNGLTADDPRLPGVMVSLYRDGGDGLFGGDDAPSGSTTSDGTGNYRFDDLTAGLYFVEQASVAGLLQRPGQHVVPVTITPADAEGTLGSSIDSYDVTTQTVQVSSLVPASSSAAMPASEAIGGERDLFVELISGSGDVEMKVNNLNRPILAFAADSGAVGRGVVTWDGSDNDADQLDADGLGGIDLTQGGANVALRFVMGADLQGSQIVLRVYRDAGNHSTATQSIPQTPNGTAQVVAILPLSDFLVSAGDGADFSRVGAVQLEIQGVSSMDAQIDDLGMIGPTVRAADFANLQPLSLGDMVWFDANDNGQRDAGETAIPNVTVALYQDTDANGIYTPGTDIFVATDTTDANGIYGFGGLLPGGYLVQVDAANFNALGPLYGLVTSTGNEPTADPDNDLDDDDNGDALAGHGVVSRAVTLGSDAEPANDGDADPNTNRTIDFGFTRRSDLEVTKSDRPDPVNAGDELIYELVVTNHGPSPATGVVVTDSLPAGVAFQNAASTAGTVSHAAGTVTANVGNLAVDGSATITITVAVDSSASSGLLNTASVVGDPLDPNPENNVTDEPTEVERRVNLSIVKTDTPDPVIAGESLTYTLVVRNDGPSDASGVTVVDTLPGGVSFTSATSSQGTVTHAAGTVTASLADLAPGATATMTLTVAVDPAARGTLLNQAVVSANEVETDPDDNRDTAETAVVTEIDLVIFKADTPDPAVAGQSLTYTLSVVNNGPSDATGVTVTDQLPAGVTFVSASASQGTATNSGGTITANLGTVANGADATVTLVVQVDPSTRGTITNTASVTGTETETQSHNNTDDEPTVVLGQVDLAITKTDSTDPVTAGEPLTYTLTVTNNGPSDATGVSVQDLLPQQVRFVSGSAGQGTVSHDQGMVTATIGNLPAGASRTITLVTEVDASFAGTMTNRASVSSNETDSNPNDNTALEPTVVDELLSRLGGFVYVDADNDGVMDPGETPLSGVTVRLVGTTRGGEASQHSAITAADGSFLFEELPAGRYELIEEQPAGYRDGLDKVGSLAASSAENDRFSGLELAAGEEAINYLFGEQLPTFSKRRFLSAR